jgi:hypothetical protein
MAKKKLTDTTKADAKSRGWKAVKLSPELVRKLHEEFGLDGTDEEIVAYGEPTDDGTDSDKGVVIAMAPSRPGSDA